MNVIQNFCMTPVANLYDTHTFDFTVQYTMSTYH